MKKQTTDNSFAAKLRKMHKAGLENSKPPDRRINCDYGQIGTIEERTRKILGIINEQGRPAGNMLCFIMYDIESNKVRRLIATYLLRQGCSRIQKSIFLADLPADRYEKIRVDLAEAQSAYDNKDSILIVPISTDYLRSMKVIGKNINIDIIARTRNTLFF